MVAVGFRIRGGLRGGICVRIRGFVWFELDICGFLVPPQGGCLKRGILGIVFWGRHVGGGG